MLLSSQQNPPSWVIPGAVVDFNFVTQQYWAGGAVSSFNQLFSFTRTTAATCTSRGGLLTYAASGGACVNDFGLQVYNANTNLLLQSQFAATWTATRSTLTANAVVSPDTATNAASLIEDSSATTTHLTVQALAKAASALPYTFSVYAKTSTRTRIAMQLDDNAGNGAIFVCDLSGQTVGVATAGVGVAFTTLTSEAYAVGAWTRCVMSATTNTAVALNATIFLDSGSGTAALSNSYSGNGTSGAPIFGAQLEQQNFVGASPYIPTTTASASRNADLVTYTIAPPLAYSLFAKAIPGTSTANVNTQTLLSLDNGTTTDRMQMARLAAGGSNAMFIASGNSTMQNVTGGTALANRASAKLGSTAQAGNQLAVAGPTLLAAATGASMPVTPTLVHIGSRADANSLVYWAGTIERVAVVPGYLASGIRNLTTNY